MFLIYLLIGLGINHATKEIREEAISCYYPMAEYLTISLYYFMFVSLRHLLICLLVPCSRKPQRLMDVSNLVYIGLDVFLVTILTVYGTQALFDQSAIDCRYQSNALMQWWVICVCCLLFGWIYSALLCLGLASMPLILVFWCFYQMQMSEI